MTKKRLDTLKQALNIVGSKKALCAALWISYDELEEYLDGKKPIPEALHLAARRIVEKGDGKPH